MYNTINELKVKKSIKTYKNHPRFSSSPQSPKWNSPKITPDATPRTKSFLDSTRHFPSPLLKLRKNLF